MNEAIEKFTAPWQPEVPPEDADGLSVVWFEDVRPNLDAADFVEDVLCSGQMSVVYGESNCGKTFFCTDLGLHVAMGWAWREKDVDRGGVIYVAAEGGYGIRNRLAAFKLHHDIADAVPFGVVPSTINLLHPDADTPRLVELIQRAEERIGTPVKLVVVDTLSRALAGGNENGPEDMGQLVHNADHVRQATGAHLMFVHHSGKDTAKGARGHSLLRAATDTEIEVTRNADGVAVARVTKQREMDCAGEFPFRLEPIAIGQNRRGKEVTSCVVVPTDEPTSTRPKVTGKAKRGLEILHNVLAARGEIVRGQRDIPSVPSVPIREWKEALQRAGVTSRDNPDTARRTFNRIREALDEKGIIRCWDERVWLTGQDGTEWDKSQMSRNTSGTDRDTPL